MAAHADATQSHPTSTADACAPDSPHANPTASDAHLPSDSAYLPMRLLIDDFFGPYVFEDQTANRPHPRFLGSVSDPTLLEMDVPYHLDADRNNLDSPFSGEVTLDTFRYYLCASLARHHGYRTACLSGTVAAHHYHSRYSKFEARFTAALRSLIAQENEEIKLPNGQQLRDLRWLERALTHEAFFLWPDIFDRAFQANANILQNLHKQMPSLLDILIRRDNPRKFLQERKLDLRNQWIYMSDAVNLLPRSCPRYKVWRKLLERLQKTRVKLNGWGELIEAAMAAVDGDGSDGRENWDRIWQRRFDSKTEWSRVGYEAVDKLGLTGWRRELGARLPREAKTARVARDRAKLSRREKELEEMAQSRTVQRERDARISRMMSVPWWLRERAGGKENARPVARQHEGASAVWDPEASA